MEQTRFHDPAYARLDLALKTEREISMSLTRLFDADECSDPEFAEMIRRATRLVSAYRDLLAEVRARPVALGCGCYLIAREG